MSPTNRPSSFLEHFLIPAVLILGLLVTVSWAALLGFGVVEVLERLL